MADAVDGEQARSNCRNIYRNSTTGSTGSYVAGSLAAYENQALMYYKQTNKQKNRQTNKQLFLIDAPIGRLRHPVSLKYIKSPKM